MLSLFITLDLFLKGVFHLQTNVNNHNDSSSRSFKYITTLPKHDQNRMTCTSGSQNSSVALFKNYSGSLNPIFRNRPTACWSEEKL